VLLSLRVYLVLLASLADKESMVCTVVIERDVEEVTEAVIKGLPLERKNLRLEEGMSKVTPRSLNDETARFCCECV